MLDWLFHRQSRVKRRSVLFSLISLAILVVIAAALMYKARPSTGESFSPATDAYFLINIGENMRVFHASATGFESLSGAESTGRFRAVDFSFDSESSILLLSLANFTTDHWAIRLPAKDSLFEVALNKPNSELQFIAEGMVPRVSPGAEYVLYTKAGHDIWLRRRIDGNESKVADDARKNVAGFAWISGHEFFYCSQQDELMRVDASNGAKVYTGKRNIVPGAASPDLNMLLCSSSSGPTILLYDLKRDTVSKLINRDGFGDSPVNNFVWSLDSRGFLYESFEGSLLQESPDLYFFDIQSGTHFVVLKNVYFFGGAAISKDVTKRIMGIETVSP